MIDETADGNAVKKAYRQASRQYHPDLWSKLAEDIKTIENDDLKRRGEALMQQMTAIMARINASHDLLVSGASESY